MTKAEQAKKAEIQGLLERNPRAVARALVVIYEFQTADEQATSTTSHANGVGFSGRDAEFGSSLAQKVLKGWALSEKQLNAGRRMVKKYWRQLALAAEKKAEAKAQAVPAGSPPADIDVENIEWGPLVRTQMFLAKSGLMTGDEADRWKDEMKERMAYDM